MSNLLVKDKQLVFPGEIVAEGIDYLPSQGIFRDNDQLVANRIGLVSIDNRLIKLIPLTGTYTPKVGDTVIGRIVNVGFSGWTVDFGFSNLAQLPVRDATNEFVDKRSDLTQYFDFDDLIVTKISNLSKGNLVDLTMKNPGLFKLSKEKGRLIDITPSKVPRVIGKQGSMISMLKNLTNCKISVGQNGKIWVEGDGEEMAVKAIELIEKESHLPGLTEKIEKLLGGNNAVHEEKWWKKIWPDKRNGS